MVLFERVKILGVSLLCFCLVMCPIQILLLIEVAQRTGKKVAFLQNYPGECFANLQLDHGNHSTTALFTCHYIFANFKLVMAPILQFSKL